MMTPDKKIVRLAPCTDVEYAEFVPLQVAEYAQQLVRAGEVPPQEGLSAAQERLTDLAADGLRSAGHDFFVAVSATRDVRVGWVWLSPAPGSIGTSRARWLSQLTVLKPYRGQGWGRAILRALEQHELDRGSEEIWLRVFDWNVPASHLYLTHGYELIQKFATDAHLRKCLVVPDPSYSSSDGRG